MKSSMTYSRTLIACLTMLAAHGAAQADPALAKSRNCMACHAVDAKVIGPGFRSVAEKYAGQAGAEEALSHKIRAGGAGKWGSVPMPANPQVSDAEAQTLAKWVLSLK